MSVCQNISYTGQWTCRYNQFMQSPSQWQSNCAICSRSTLKQRSKALKQTPSSRLHFTNTRKIFWICRGAKVPVSVLLHPPIVLWQTNKIQLIPKSYATPDGLWKIFLTFGVPLRLHIWWNAPISKNPTATVPPNEPIINGSEVRSGRRCLWLKLFGAVWIKLTVHEPRRIWKPGSLTTSMLGLNRDPKIIVYEIPII